MPPRNRSEQMPMEPELREDDTLSDDQMNQLLQQAQHRLHETAVNHPHSFRALALPSAFKLDPGPIAQPYIISNSGVFRAEPRRLVNDNDRQLSNNLKVVEDPIRLKDRAVKLKSQTLDSHFNMPRTVIDGTLKADLSLRKLRGVLDPKQHYKKESSKSLISEFSEVGRIIEGPLEYKTRLPNKERKRTFIEEVLANETSMGRFKKKYNEIQSSKSSGKKAHYKSLQSKRSGGVSKR